MRLSVAGHAQQQGRPTPRRLRATVGRVEAGSSLSAAGVSAAGLSQPAAACRPDGASRRLAGFGGQALGLAAGCSAASGRFLRRLVCWRRRWPGRAALRRDRRRRRWRGWSGCCWRDRCRRRGRSGASCAGVAGGVAGFTTSVGGGAPCDFLIGFSTFSAAIDSRIQIAATTIVIRVNRSPALVPKALWPPMPPKAPVKPPPRPRWTRITRIRNTDSSASGMHEQIMIASSRPAEHRPSQRSDRKSTMRARSYFAAAAMIAKKPSAFRRPRRPAPRRCSAGASSSAALSGFTLPPY